MTLKLELTKDSKQVVSLGLDKNSKFYAELFWLSKEDLDAHGIAITNHKGVRSINANPNRVLSVYNKGTVLLSGDKTKTLSQGKLGSPFELPEGYLMHSGDVRPANSFDVNPEEVITIDTSNIPNSLDPEDEINEIAFFISIHPPQSNTFEMVKDAKLVIKDESGKALLEASLTDQFKNSNIVHLGSVVKDASGSWSYDATASGTIGDLNTLLAQL